jgi:fatty-acid desaturase
VVVIVTTGVVLLVTAVASTLTLLSHSLGRAIALVVVELVVWLRAETMAVTVCLHRFLTHGSVQFEKPQVIKFWLWWVRSGGVRYWEWVENHTWHHYYADTEWDSYTPNAVNTLTGQPPLKAPWPWNFWMNAVSYRKFAKWLEVHPEALQDLAEKDPSSAGAIARLNEIAWLRPVYGRVWRGQSLAILAFALSAIPLAVKAGPWWSIPTIIAVPGLMYGLKIALYLYGGQIINYWGHRAAGSAHQSDIPWLWMILTLWMMGEGFHEFHHDAPFSARFHRFLDPGWWTIAVMYRFGLVSNVVVAIPEPIPRRYRPRLYPLVT